MVTKSDDSLTIDKLAADATPKNIQIWIETLQAQYAEKKSRVRKELQEKVLELVSSNGYTLEELFGARILPTTAELAEQARKKASASAARADRMIDAAS